MTKITRYVLLLTLILLGSFSWNVLRAGADVSQSSGKSPAVGWQIAQVPAVQAGARGVVLDSPRTPGQDVANYRVSPERSPESAPPPMAVQSHTGALRPREVTAKDFYLNVVGVSNPNALVVKFTEEAMVRWKDGKPYSKRGASVSPVLNFLAKHPDIRMERDDPTQPEELFDFWEANGERNTGQDLANLNNFYRFLIPENQDPMALIREVLSWDIVETAFYEPRAQLACTDVPPTTPSWVANQDYEDPAPLGVDAQYSWGYDPTYGRGRTGYWCIDIEYDWTENHEDFPSDFGVLGGGDTGAPADHGDAVVGIVVACNNSYGMTGISSNITVQGISWWEQSGSTVQERWISAFNLAATYLYPGEAYMIEIHQPGPDPGYSCDTLCGNCGQFGFIAVEYWDDVFAVIQTHTANGILVYEAAGNGQMNLDNPVYGNRFQRWYRDSGAILVGAGIPNTRVGECWSNYGSRLDLQGWGDSVYSTGYGNLWQGSAEPDRTQWYTSSFSGTSSATPIVAGSGNCMQGISQGKFGITLTPAQMRDYLSTTGTAWAGSHDVGERPNLAAAINYIEPDVAPYTRGGWYSSFVPRNTTGTTVDNCPLTTLDGNTNDTYWNVSGKNWGRSPAPDWPGTAGVYSEIYLDGGTNYWVSWPVIQPGQEFIGTNMGPVTVRGGRHTIRWYIDPYDAFNEYDENNNWVTEQFVWSPLQLTNNAGIVRAAPPLKSWGGPVYYNGDGFRATGAWWTAVAVLPQSGNDVDLYSYADSYSSTSGFDTYQEISARGSGSTDLILVNGNVLGFGQSRLFQAIRYSDASTANYAIEADASYTISAQNYEVTKTMASNDIFDIFEFYQDTTEPFFVGVGNVSGGLDLTLLIFPPGIDYYQYTDYLYRSDLSGANGSEWVMNYTPYTGWHAAVVLKESYASYGVSGSYTFILQRPPVVNLSATSRTGWDAPLVMRNTADATPSYCVFPPAIEGNAANYVNATWYNSGGYIISSAFRNDVYVDGETVARFSNSTSLSPLTYGQAQNYGPVTIRGGRHTLRLVVDATDMVSESNESDNTSEQQYVWSPWVLYYDTPLTRQSPPAQGSGAYPNSDGFSFTMPGVYASGTAILPKSLSADYDVYLYSDYSGTFSGFSSLVDVSAFGGGVPDYVIVPWRRLDTQSTWYPAVINYNGASDSTLVEFDHTFARTYYMPPWQLANPDTIGAGAIWNMYETYLASGTHYQFFCDMLSGTADVELRMHRDSLDYQWRGGTVAAANSAGGGGDETLVYTPTITDWYILVVSKTTANDANTQAIYNLNAGTGGAPPWPVNNLVAQFWSSPSGIRLVWSHVNQDTLGNPLNGRRYVIYRNADPLFVPTSPDSIGGTTDSIFVDTGALSSQKNFYRVTVKAQ